MYPEHFSASKNERTGVPTPQRTTAATIIKYDPPVYRENPKGCYIEFRAFDPELGRMRRKRMKINRIDGKLARRKYAKEVIAELNEKLKNGWNPWIEKDLGDLMTFTEGLTHYENFLEKMMADGLYRKETYAGYRSYVKMLKEYIEKHKHIFYMYQFDRKFCIAFLDYVFIERNNGAQTRNNYLGFLKTFSGFLVEKGFLKSRPTEGIAPISKRLYKKGRTVIPIEVVGKIADYCKTNEKHFLLACYLLYYCFIRPVEMTRLKIKHINVKDCTIFIPGECSKNHQDQTVTLPKKVLFYAIEIGVIGSPQEDYIFSYNLRPGKEQIDPKHFRDHWDNVRRALKLKPEWKFYSLKDTGITEMCDNNMATIAVRDQARHSSLAITDIYTRHNAKANKDIVDLDGAL